MITRRRSSSIMMAAGLLMLDACDRVHEKVPTATYDRPSPLFEYLDSTATGIGFINTLNETNEWNLLLYEYLYNGAGVAIGDINNDGLQDIYFVSNSGSDRLYLNEGGFRFRDISVSSGISDARGYKTGVTMADVNGDGWPDIHVCRSALADRTLRRNLLYINNGDLTFTESAAQYGLDDASYSTQAYFFDMDLDGDLDMYLVNHPADMREANNIGVVEGPDGKLRIHISEDLTYVSDRLYRNMGGRFEDVTKEMGLENEAFGLSAVIGYFNDDRYPDIYVCNDYSRSDQLLLSDGRGGYRQAFDEQFLQCALSSMGSDMADINNDGCPDLITLDMVARDHYRYKTLTMEQNYDKYRKSIAVGLSPQFSKNTLQLNNCNGTFSDIAFLSNMHYTDWSWSALLIDLDNDGWKDAHITNGYVRDLTNNDYRRYDADGFLKDLKQGKITLMDWLNGIPSVKVRSFLFRNQGDLTFADMADDWGSGPPAFSNGAAYADLDNDGYLDLVVNNINDPAFIMRNTGADRLGHDHVRFRLDAGAGRTVVGSTVHITTSDGMEQMQQVQPTRGFLSSSEPLVHFGLGTGRTVEEVRITWPDGSEQRMDTPAINRTHHVERKTDRSRPSGPRPSTLFSVATPGLPGSFSHMENEYIDFKREPLLHHKLSEEGPAVAVADVNGDGTDDVYVGGSSGNTGRLFLQDRSGRFSEVVHPVFNADRNCEDVAALFFDANGDGHPDLYVVSGGNERPALAPEYQDRLYVNDGRGNFAKATNALPTAHHSGSCITALDIDGDGDLDLFIGSRCVPGRYPLAPTSQLLRNDGGRFTDVTTSKAKGLAEVGMVTAAGAADLDGDGIPELVLVGEWMPVSVFRQVEGTYRNTTAEFGLQDTRGWWCSLVIGDLNGDGLPELIAGNLGLNAMFKASPQVPLRMHAKDFDNNGTIDPMLWMHQDGAYRPVHMRDRVLDQMIYLKKRYQRYEPYAHATMNDLFTADQLRGAQVLEAVTMAHTIYYNVNGSSFTAEPLPNHSQLSMARAMTLVDLDKDGHWDVIVAGNMYGTDAQFGRYDACIGSVLLNNGQGELRWMPPAESGSRFRGNVRSLHPMTVASRSCLLVARNNGPFELVDIQVAPR